MMRKSASVSRLVLTIAALSLTTVLPLAGCGQNGGAKDGNAVAGKDAKAGDAKPKSKTGGRTPQSVSVAAVELQPFSPRLIVAGQVQAVQEARVFPTASGARVLQLLADAGDRVRAGQTLARLDARQIAADSELLAAQVRRARTALAEAETGLAAARQNFARTQSGPKESGLDTRGVDAQLVEARAALARAQSQQRETALSTEQAEIALRQANEEAQRALALKDDGALSVEATRARVLQAEQAAARLRSQRQDIAAILDSRRAAVAQLEARSDTSRGDAQALLDARRQAVAQAEARVAAARADLQVAVAQQAQSNIRQNDGLVTAPVSGLVTARNVSVGEIAGTSGQPMFTITSNDLLEVAAEVPEADLSNLALGMTARFRAPDGSEVVGILRRPPAQIDAQRRTGIARFSLEPGRAVSAGMFLTGEATGTGRSVLAVPASALMYGREGASVFVLRADSTVRRALVQTGLRQGPLVEIVSGVAPNMLVVSAGAAFLAEGEKVNAVREDPTRPSGPAAVSPAPAEPKK